MECYLISSKSHYLLDEEIKRLTKDINEVTTFSLDNTTIYDCIEDASYFGLFNEKKALIIKNVKYFGGKFLYEDESKAILDFISNVNNDILIIFVCDQISKTKDITKKALSSSATVIDFSNIDDIRFKETIDNYIKDNEIILDENAYNEIKKRTLNDLDITINEINKISNINKHITLDIVKEYGIELEDDKTFEFSNAVVAKNIPLAIEILDKLLNQGVDPFSIVGLLSSSFLNIYMVKEAMRHNMSDEEIAKRLGYSGTGRVYVMKKNGKIYTMDQLKEIILKLADADLKIKTGYNPVYTIKELLIVL